jgi:hypothetical protein
MPLICFSISWLQPIQITHYFFLISDDNAHINRSIDSENRKIMVFIRLKLFTLRTTYDYKNVWWGIFNSFLYDVGGKNIYYVVLC